MCAIAVVLKGRSLLEMCAQRNQSQRSNQAQDEGYGIRIGSGAHLFNGGREVKQSSEVMLVLPTIISH